MQDTAHVVSDRPPARLVVYALVNSNDDVTEFIANGHHAAAAFLDALRRDDYCRGLWDGDQLNPERVCHTYYRTSEERQPNGEFWSLYEECQSEDTDAFPVTAIKMPY